MGIQPHIRGHQANDGDTVKDFQVHNLKCWPIYFQEVKAKRKGFEYRLDDRGYKAGDALCLHEWDPVTGEFTGEISWHDVPYMMTAPNGFVIMSIQDPKPGSNAHRSEVEIMASDSRSFLVEFYQRPEFMPERKAPGDFLAGGYCSGGYTKGVAGLEPKRHQKGYR